MRRSVKHSTRNFMGAFRVGLRPTIKDAVLMPFACLVIVVEGLKHIMLLGSYYPEITWGAFLLHSISGFAGGLDLHWLLQLILLVGVAIPGTFTFSRQVRERLICQTENVYVFIWAELAAYFIRVIVALLLLAALTLLCSILSGGSTSLLVANGYTAIVSGPEWGQSVSSTLVVLAFVNYMLEVACIGTLFFALCSRLHKVASCAISVVALFMSVMPRNPISPLAFGQAAQIAELGYGTHLYVSCFVGLSVTTSICVLFYVTQSKSAQLQTKQEHRRTSRAILYAIKRSALVYVTVICIMLLVVILRISVYYQQLSQVDMTEFANVGDIFCYILLGNVHVSAGVNSLPQVTFVTIPFDWLLLVCAPYLLTIAFTDAWLKPQFICRYNSRKDLATHLAFISLIQTVIYWVALFILVFIISTVIGASSDFSAGQSFVYASSMQGSADVGLLAQGGDPAQFSRLMQSLTDVANTMGIEHLPYYLLVICIVVNLIYIPVILVTYDLFGPVGSALVVALICIAPIYTNSDFFLYNQAMAIRLAGQTSETLKYALGLCVATLCMVAHINILKTRELGGRSA